MRSGSHFIPTLLLASASLCACSASYVEAPDARSDAITSEVADILDFTFEAEVIADDTVAARRSVVRQLLYAQGMLRTASSASGQIGNVSLPEMTETLLGEKKRITYKAVLPIAWPKSAEVPASYELLVPRDVTTLRAFNRKYDGKCGASQ